MRFVRFLQLCILLMYAVQNGMSAFCGYYRDCHEVTETYVNSTTMCISLVLMGTCPQKTESCVADQEFVHTPDLYTKPWSCASHSRYSCVGVTVDPCHKIGAEDCSTKPAKTACEAFYQIVGITRPVNCPPGEKMTYTPELFPGPLWRCYRKMTYIKEVGKCDEINEANCYMRWGNISCSNTTRNVRCPLQPGFCPPEHIYTYTPIHNSNALGHSEKWTCLPRNKGTIKIKYCHEVDIHNCHKYWGQFSCNNQEHKTECPPLWVDCPPGQTYRFTPGKGEKNWSCHSGKVTAVEDCHDIKFTNCQNYEGTVDCGNSTYEVVCPKVVLFCPPGEDYLFTPEFPSRPWSCYGFDPVTVPTPPTPPTTPGGVLPTPPTTPAGVFPTPPNAITAVYPPPQSTPAGVFPTPPTKPPVVSPTPPITINVVWPPSPTTPAEVSPTPPTKPGAVSPTPPTTPAGGFPTPPTAITAVYPPPPSTPAGVFPTPPTKPGAVSPTPPITINVVWPPSPTKPGAVSPTPPTKPGAVSSKPPTTPGAVSPTPPTTSAVECPPLPTLPPLVCPAPPTPPPVVCPLPPIPPPLVCPPPLPLSNVAHPPLPPLPNIVFPPLRPLRNIALPPPQPLHNNGMPPPLPLPDGSMPTVPPPSSKADNCQCPQTFHMQYVRF